jgi:hypothetical protein
MSRIFYDHLIILEEVEFHINKVAKTPVEKEELWGLVDEIVHHRVLAAILAKLPEENHSDFLNRFHSAPFDDNLMSYLNEKINEDVEVFISSEVESLSGELLRLLEDTKKKK